MQLRHIALFTGILCYYRQGISLQVMAVGFAPITPVLHLGNVAVKVTEPGSPLTRGSLLAYHLRSSKSPTLRNRSLIPVTNTSIHVPGKCLRQTIGNLSRLWDFDEPYRVHLSTFKRHTSSLSSVLLSGAKWVDWFPVQERVLDGFTGGAEDPLLVDMAGGRGQDIKAFQGKFPNTPGRLILQDQAHVLAEAQVGDKMEKMSFDLSKPQEVKGAKIYYLQKIMHDWSDSQCQESLQHTRNAMTKGYSKLIIEEFIMPEKEAPLLGTLWDWQILVWCTSMERDQKHWDRLLTSAGFKVVKFWPPPGDGHHIIESKIA